MKEIRFEFGKNWQRFLKDLNAERIAEAEKSLREMLEVDDLRGKTFLDIGSGSGLFSLAAVRLGAARVHSCDYDLKCVRCSEDLKQRFFPEAGEWVIEQGSALDAEYLSSLGQFDVVYSWGVLHHTGNLQMALANVVRNVRPGGKLFISIANDQGFYSRLWKRVKRYYSRSPFWRLPIIAGWGSFFMVKGFIKDVFFLQKNPLKRYSEYKRSRGMSYFTDLIDWLGGYPFEVASPGFVFQFYDKQGFDLVRLNAPGYGHACNEYVFKRRI